MKLFIVALFFFNLTSPSVFAKSEKVDMDSGNIDFIAVKGTPYNFEYFVDRKAHLCFGVRMQGLASVPCEALLHGYPELKKYIDWIK